MAKLRGAVVGGGRMGRLHAAHLAARDEVHLVGVFDPAPDTRLQLPWIDGVPRDLDFAVVATPSEFHFEASLPLLESGVACLVEKPLASRLEAVTKLAEFERLSVNHLERYNPAIGVLSSKARPRYVRTERLAPGSGRNMDVDVVLDLMVHDIDLVLHLAGGEVTDMRAVGTGVGPSGVDIAEVWLELSTGCVATLAASRLSDGVSRRMRVVCEEDYWSLDLLNHTAEHVFWRENARQKRDIPVLDRDPLWCMHDAFLGAVRGERVFPVPGSEAAEAVVLALRIGETIRKQS